MRPSGPARILHHAMTTKDVAIPADALDLEGFMRIPLTACLSGIAIASGLVAPAATASTTQGISMWPGSVCQLSIPTTNTGVRPKATGFRNESTTTSNFVICPIPNAVGISNDNSTAGVLRLYSMDGASHSVSCTPSRVGTRQTCITRRKPSP